MLPPRLRLLAILASVALTLGGASLSWGHPMDATDWDHDNFKNWADNCPNNYNPKQTDTDGDTPAPVADSGQSNPNTGPILVYPFTEGGPTALPTDRPADVGGDSCDVDDDGDGITDNPKRDNCKLVANKDQTDTDFDGLGDACDSDDDNDEVVDAQDNCPLVSNAGQVDFDRDGRGDACDPDGPKAQSSSGLNGGDPNDKTPPKVTLRAGSRYSVEAIQRGLAVGVVCSEGCILEAELAVARSAARRLGVASKSSRPRIGRGAAQIEAQGFTYVFVPVKATTLKRLARARSVKATLRVVARDANGNRRVATKRLRLGR